MSDFSRLVPLARPAQFGLPACMTHPHGLKEAAAIMAGRLRSRIHPVPVALFEPPVHPGVQA
jgi:hypothetical protein